MFRINKPIWALNCVRTRFLLRTQSALLAKPIQNRCCFSSSLPTDISELSNKDVLVKRIKKLSLWMKESDLKKSLPKSTLDGHRQKFQEYFACLMRLNDDDKKKCLSQCDFSLVALCSNFKDSAKASILLSDFKRFRIPLQQQILTPFMTALHIKSAKQLLCNSKTELGFEPTASALNNLLRRPEILYEEAKQIAEDASSQLNIKPDRGLFATLFSKLGNQPASKINVQEVDALLAKMEAHQLKPDAVLYASILNIYATVGDMDKAQQLLKRMAQEGTAANVSVWNALLKFPARSGDWKQALEFFQQMKAANIKPNEYTFAEILAGFQKRKASPEEVFNLMQEAKDTVERPYSLYDKAFSCLAKSDDPSATEVAERLFEQLPNPSIEHWNLLAKIYGAKGDVDAVKDIYEKRMAKTLQMNKTSRELLEKAHNKSLMGKLFGSYY